MGAESKRRPRTSIFKISIFLIDSNIILYSYLSQYNYLKNIFLKESTFVSEITKVEVLGYHKLTKEEEAYLKDVFKIIPSIFPSQQVFDTAIDIRKTFNLKLGDSLIAATAIVHELTIYSRNLKDFEKIPQLKSINPIA
ncbi:MAG: domain nuclease [Mucilaginibacter sp.]|jgi:predicted nucleic acid-binding protein|nr:domain nuclease [Mucilaginibacter sp.]MDB5138828.1 domain nuclease [Mucilaginibacter sp.]